jgi:hypothetical protein
MEFTQAPYFTHTKELPRLLGECQLCATEMNNWSATEVRAPNYTAGE